MSLTPEQKHLVESAREICGHFPLRSNEWAFETYSAGGVAAAVQSSKGNIYTGISFDLACGIGFCAESSAVAEMLKHMETHITNAIAKCGDIILSPCGRCRELFAQLDARNLDMNVIVASDQVVSLGELLPIHWLYIQAEI